MWKSEKVPLLACFAHIIPYNQLIVNTKLHLDSKQNVCYYDEGGISAPVFSHMQPFPDSCQGKLTDVLHTLS